MGVAEDAAGQQFGVLADLRFRIQATARVVEIDVLLGIETTVLGRTEAIDGASVAVFGIGPDELLMRGKLGRSRGRRA